MGASQEVDKGLGAGDTAGKRRGAAGAPPHLAKLAGPSPPQSALVFSRYSTQTPKND